jgi:hypothetical protein
VLCFSDDARILVDFEAWIDAQYSRVRVSVRRETVKFESVVSVL